jgi:hypothetical protein
LNGGVKNIVFRRLLTCTAAGLLLGTATEAAGLLGKIAKLAEKKPVPFELQTAPETLAKDYLKLDKLEPLKGMKRVAFPAFQVEFELESNESATSVARQFGEGGGAQASVSTRYFLKGVDDALCQKVTDQLYASVTAQFQAAGLRGRGPRRREGGRELRQAAPQAHPVPHRQEQARLRVLRPAGHADLLQARRPAT